MDANIAKQSQQEAVHILEAYCRTENIQLHPSIESRVVEGAGVGIYSKSKLKAGEKLVQVPVKQIFTTSKIPESFLALCAREGIPVHAQLATFFAYASDEDLSRYEPWMATWPRLSDFTDAMPIFWGYWAEYILLRLGKLALESKNDTIVGRTSKRRRVSVVENGQEETRGVDVQQTITSCPIVCLGPALSGMFGANRGTTSHGQLRKMSDKLVSHIQAINKALPDHRIIEDDQQLIKFMHAWCLVNTRCFYYNPAMTTPALKKLKGRGKAPNDPNEAMALCPYMDLFNHRAPPPPATVSVQLPCKVRCNTTGFQVITDSIIPANSEILLSYGAHTNDTLWSEYGFMLPGDTNNSDYIALDEIVLEGLKSTEKTVLEQNGYMDNYVLHNDSSVCYRTEMVAWLLVLGSRKWTKVVNEGLDPEEECTSPTGKSKFIHIQEGWLQKVVEAAEREASTISQMEKDCVARIFGTISIIRRSSSEAAGRESGLVETRRKMCLTRWQQIRQTASRGLETLST